MARAMTLLEAQETDSMLTVLRLDEAGETEQIVAMIEASMELPELPHERTI